MLGRLSLWLGVAAAVSCSPPNAGRVVIGEPTYVCVTFNNAMMSYYVPTADTMAMIQFANASKGIPSNFGYGASNVGFTVPPANQTNPVVGPLPDNVYYHAFSVSSYNTADNYRVYQTWNLTTNASGQYLVYNRFAPLTTAIITVDNGVPTSVSYDDGCFTCDAFAGNDC